MTRRIRATARIACLAFLLAAAPALGADEAAVDRCFELRDDDPAAAVAEARSALALPPPGPEVEIKLRICLARSLALTGDAAGAQAEVAAVDALLARHPMPPEAHAARGDIFVVSSRLPVRWQRQAPGPGEGAGTAARAAVHIRRTPRPRDCSPLPAHRRGAQKEGCMIKWAIIFAIIGLIAGVVGFTGIAGAAIGIAQFLFWAGIIIAVVLFILGYTVFKKVT